MVQIEFNYEHVPFFCFLCGRFGHSEKYCSHVNVEQMEKGFGWGRWIKASPRKRCKREKEEVQALCAQRKSLFVCKKPLDVSPLASGNEESQEGPYPVHNEGAMLLFNHR